MSQFRYEVQGLQEFTAMAARLGDGRAGKIANETVNRVGPSVRRMMVDELKGRLPIQSAIVNKLVRFYPQGSRPALLRFMGTGRRGVGFVRPRHLALSLPTVGRFSNGVPRFGNPATKIPRTRTYFNGFTLVPGVKRSKKYGTAATSRTLKRWDGTTRGASKVQVFQRPTSQKYPIRLVPGMRLRELAPIDQMAEQARVLIVLRTQLELERRLAVELNKKR